MGNQRVDVTAMFSTASGATCITESFPAASRLEEVIAWARQLETEGRSLVELICDMRAGGGQQPRPGGR